MSPFLFLRSAVDGLFFFFFDIKARCSFFSAAHAAFCDVDVATPSLLFVVLLLLLLLLSDLDDMCLFKFFKYDICSRIFLTENSFLSKGEEEEEEEEEGSEEERRGEEYKRESS